MSRDRKRMIVVKAMTGMTTKMLRYMVLSLLMLLMAAAVWSLPVTEAQAQQTQAADTEAETAEEPPIRLGTPYLPFNQSLFFSEDDITRIRVTLAGMDSDLVTDGGEGDKPENRMLRLSGITYSGPDQWMIWLNGLRITPHNMPPQMVDISVARTYIDLKWFDNTLKKIIMIRLRPNQVYDINTGIMLPG